MITGDKPLEKTVACSSFLDLMSPVGEVSSFAPPCAPIIVCCPAIAPKH